MSDQENQASRFARDIAANAEKMFKATQLIANTRDEDVNIGTTPKHLVMRRDKVELFHYEPMAAATAKTPVLLAYGLIGRYTMADLQPDRSLVRSLLAKGLDLWLIDGAETFRADPEPPHGVDDWQSRRTTVRVEPQPRNPLNSWLINFSIEALFDPDATLYYIFMQIRRRQYELDES